MELLNVNLLNARAQLIRLLLFFNSLFLFKIFFLILPLYLLLLLSQKNYTLKKKNKWSIQDLAPIVLETLISKTFQWNFRNSVSDNSLNRLKIFLSYQMWLRLALSLSRWWIRGMTFLYWFTGFLTYIIAYERNKVFIASLSLWQQTSGIHYTYNCCYWLIALWRWL